MIYRSFVCAGGRLDIEKEWKGQTFISKIECTREKIEIEYDMKGSSAVKMNKICVRDWGGQTKQGRTFHWRECAMHLLRHETKF